MADRVVLHIGVHKTGTTAVQAWAHANRNELRDRCGIAVFEGQFDPGHAIELPVLCMRPDRNMNARAKHPDWCLPAWQADARAYVEAQLATAAPTIFCSAEGLSQLRHADELAVLKELLGPRQVDVIVMLRDRDDFLRSYRQSIQARGHRPSRYPDSFAYVEPDSWVADFEGLVAAYREAFGAEHVTVLSYEDALGTYRSTIPAVAQAAGIAPADLPPWEGIWLNASRAQPPRPLAARARRVVRHPIAALTRRVRRRPRTAVA
jgi:hypothetical protein